MGSNRPTSTPVAVDQAPTSGGAIKAIAFGRFNDDALSHLFVWQFNSSSQNTATVYSQSATGGLTRNAAASTSVQMLLNNTGVDALTIGDLDLDGRDDIVIARGNTLTAFINQPNGTWRQSQLSIPAPTDISATDKVTGLAVGLLDSDQLPDLVVSSATGQRIGVYINQ